MAPRQPALPGGTVALTWAPLYMSDHHEYTRREAVALARKFDLISAMPYGLKDHSSAMRAANRDLTLLAYSNATLADPSLVRSLPESAYAHNASGGRIKANGWNTYLMQPDNAQWRATADRLCEERSELGGFDGCLVDMLTLGIYARGYMTSLPADPSTGRTYSQEQYRDHMVRLAADLRNRSPELVQVGNMVENSYRYWESDVPSRPLVNSSPSAQMEDFLRGAHDGVNDWPSAAEWKKNVDVVTDMERSGKTGLFTTKVWSAANSQVAAQWQAYSMATFLMGANGRSFFAFTRSRDKAGASQTNARYTMPRPSGCPGVACSVSRRARGSASSTAAPRWSTPPAPRSGPGARHHEAAQRLGRHQHDPPRPQRRRAGQRQAPALQGQHQERQEDRRRRASRSLEQGRRQGHQPRRQDRPSRQADGPGQGPRREGPEQKCRPAAAGSLGQGPGARQGEPRVRAGSPGSASSTRQAASATAPG